MGDAAPIKLDQTTQKGKLAMNHRTTHFVLMAATLALLGCGRANLFEASENRNADPMLKANGEVTIALDVAGGLAGIQQNLTIYANGYTRFVDVQSGRGEIVASLSPEQYGELVALFLHSDFLHLDDRYMLENTADAFAYEVQFNYAGSRKRVVTDNLEAPAGLQAIIARLSELIRELTDKSLTLELTLDRAELQHGESVTLTLLAANQTRNTLRLHTGGQKFDFFAYPAAVLSPVPPSGLHGAEPVWRWAADKAFIAIVEEIALAPGQRLQYSVVWEGKANSGELLEGTYYVGARLTASPGGSTALHELRITKR